MPSCGRRVRPQILRHDRTFITEARQEVRWREYLGWLNCGLHPDLVPVK
jgi:hypothetical protein